jgi:hypothetical protein
MFEDSRGSVTMIATQRETAGACAGSGNAAALGAADWLSLAAAPTFAIMALLTGVLHGGRPDMLCSAAQGASLLTGMVPMYLLMSAFHSAPWLKLIFSRRSGAHRSGFGVRQIEQCQTFLARERSQGMTSCAYFAFQPAPSCAVRFERQGLTIGNARPALRRRTSPERDRRAAPSRCLEAQGQARRRAERPASMCRGITRRERTCCGRDQRVHRNPATLVTPTVSILGTRYIS